VDDRELLSRIDEHIARGNRLLEEVREEMRRNRESTERLFARQDEMFSEQVTVLRGLSDVIKKMGSSLARELSVMTDELRDLREQGRAQTEALWQMIDRMNRLDPGGAGA